MQRNENMNFEIKTYNIFFWFKDTSKQRVERPPEQRRLSMHFKCSTKSEIRKLLNKLNAGCTYMTFLNSNRLIDPHLICTTSPVFNSLIEFTRMCEKMCYSFLNISVLYHDFSNYLAVGTLNFESIGNFQYK